MKRKTQFFPITEKSCRVFFEVYFYYFFIRRNGENETKKNEKSVYAKISNFMNLLLLPHTEKEEILIFTDSFLNTNRYLANSRSLS